MTRITTCLLPLFALAACMPVEPGEPVVASPGSGSAGPGSAGPGSSGPGSSGPESSGSDCDAAAGDPFIGQLYSDETGQRLLEATGARSLRPILEGSPVTMDYNPVRLTVSYDEDMAIVGMACG